MVNTSGHRHAPARLRTRVRAGDRPRMEHAEQLDLIAYLAHGAAGPLPDPGFGPCVHREHSPPSTSSVPLRPVPATAAARPRMSARRLLVCLTVLGWSDRELARRTDRHQTTVARWTGGTSPVDPEVAAWLETLVALHEAHPAPRRARRGGTGAPVRPPGPNRPTPRPDGSAALPSVADHFTPPCHTAASRMP